MTPATAAITRFNKLTTCARSFLSVARHADHPQSGMFEKKKEKQDRRTPSLALLRIKRQLIFPQIESNLRLLFLFVVWIVLVRFTQRWVGRQINATVCSLPVSSLERAHRNARRYDLRCLYQCLTFLYCDQGQSQENYLRSRHKLRRCSERASRSQKDYFVLKKHRSCEFSMYHAQVTWAESGKVKSGRLEASCVTSASFRMIVSVTLPLDLEHCFTKSCTL